MSSYKVEFHRVWVKTIEADSRKRAREIAELKMGEESDAEDYNYSVVKNMRQPDRDSGGEGHNSVWGS
jgi:hypothetical protein